MENVVFGRIRVPMRLWLSLNVSVDDAAWDAIVRHCESLKSYSGVWSAVAVCLTPSPLLGWELLICLISVWAPILSWSVMVLVDRSLIVGGNTKSLNVSICHRLLWYAIAPPLALS